ncbi:MAG: hypothetical protein AB1512_04100 [Thermodesulfobacteriota bacterium]
MTRYLLAAEADKIQDFIFRSARLREVVGGSQLLTRLCKEVPSLLAPRYGIQEEDVIIGDGGSFRILFSDADRAKGFGADLAEVYHRAGSGSLTVAEPVPVNGDFGKASEHAEDALHRAKRLREDWQSQVHLPYMAFCASCGVGLAVAHWAYYAGEEARYLCESCLNKGAERPYGELGSFLRAFYEVVVGPERDPAAFDWPGKTTREEFYEKDPVEDIAAYDARRYVAYLMADGNNMGKAFSACQTPEQMRALCQGLSHAFRKALAEPTRLITNNNADDRLDFIPVLPLILGGDDLFALVPAPWALDIARRFCQVYEQEMTDLLRTIGLSVPSPTVSAAVVICKSKHPYSLAHAAGEVRLKEAKRMGKRLVLDGGQICSTISFEVVLGGRLVTPPAKQVIRPTLRPYWADALNVPDYWGLTVKQLIDQRYELRNLPHKRLSELRSLYDPTSLPSSLKPNDIEPWWNRLKRLLQRIERRSDAQKEAVTATLESLGSPEESYWRRVDRKSEDTWHGHGLPDLIEAWDFALNLEIPRWEYEEE